MDPREGFEIPDRQELNGSELSAIPDLVRRRISGYVFLGGALAAVLAGVMGLPAGVYGMAALMALIGSLNLLAAWRLDTTAEEALAAAGRHITFPIGHASAAVTFEGWRSRPVWQVVAYSADDPPTTRAIVRVDGVSGVVLGDAYEQDVSNAF